MRRFTNSDSHLRWSAPELVRSRRYDERVDVFSYGLLIWEMFTGQLPFADLEPAQVAAKMVCIST